MIYKRKYVWQKTLVWKRISATTTKTERFWMPGTNQLKDGMVNDFGASGATDLIEDAARISKMR